MNLPNLLSLFRMCLVPVFIAVFFSNTEHAHVYAAIIYAVAGITDVLDGIIARKFNLITKLGKILDPLADKMMTITVFVCITFVGLIPWWSIALIFAKDVLLVLGGVKLYREMSAVFQSNILGKLATVFLVIGGVLILLFETLIPPLIKTAFAYMAVLISFCAFFSYLYQYCTYRKKRKSDETLS
ncbi:MAG: CDP-alcohol phosphatidyltransferase family protein [Oscillospiraceae bacterium]|nr:CDP-alcohol phosphatidyltransferase family protein [Oscillospiraceae bacterium]